MTLDLFPWNEGSAALVGRAVLASLWQVTAVVAGYALLARMLSSPRWRYVAACVGLLASVVLPIATTIRSPREIPSTPTPTLRMLEAVPLASGPLSEVPPASSSHVAWRRVGSAAVPWLGHAWAIGVLLMLLRISGGAVRARRFAAEARPCSSELEARVRTLARRLALRPTPRLGATTRFDVPCVLGALRPVVLIPVSLLTGLSPAQLDSLLLHELAHVRRNDYLAHLVQSVAEALLFFHPAARWLSRRARVERELCCDDIVLAAGVRPVDYAGALTRLEGARVQALAPAAGPTGLLGRVRRILGETSERTMPSSLAAPTVLLAVVVAAAAFAQQREPVATGQQGASVNSTEAGVVQASVWVLEVDKESFQELSVDWKRARTSVRFAVGAAEELLGTIERWGTEGRATVLSAPTLQLIEGERGGVRTSFGEPEQTNVALDLLPTVRGSAIDFVLGFRVGGALPLRSDAHRILWRVAVEPDQVALVWDDVNDSRTQRARVLLLSAHAVAGDATLRSAPAASPLASLASSEPVSLSLNDADLGAVIDSFAREYGFHLDFDEAAQAMRASALTAELNETPGDLVLDSILRLACLEGQETETGVLRIRVGNDPLCATAERARTRR